MGNNASMTASMMRRPPKCRPHSPARAEPDRPRSDAWRRGAPSAVARRELVHREVGDIHLAAADAVRVTGLAAALEVEHPRVAVVARLRDRPKLPSRHCAPDVSRRTTALIARTRLCVPRASDSARRVAEGERHEAIGASSRLIAVKRAATACCSPPRRPRARRPPPDTPARPRVTGLPPFLPSMARLGQPAAGCDEARGRPPAAAHRARGGRDRHDGDGPPRPPAARARAARRSAVQAGAVARDPDGDGSFRVNGGLKAARELLLHLNRLGVPTAVDFADTVTPQFFADLVSCASVSSPTRRANRRNSAQFCVPVSDAQPSRRRSPPSPRRCASSSPASRCPSACVRPSTTPPPPSARTRSRRRPTTSSASRPKASAGSCARRATRTSSSSSRRRCRPTPPPATRRPPPRRSSARRAIVCVAMLRTLRSCWRSVAPTRRRRATARWSTRRRRRWRRATRGWSVCG